MSRCWDHMTIKKLLPFTWWQYVLIGGKVYGRKLAASSELAFSDLNAKKLLQSKKEGKSKCQTLSHNHTPSAGG